MTEGRSEEGEEWGSEIIKRFKGAHNRGLKKQRKEMVDDLRVWANESVGRGSG